MYGSILKIKGVNFSGPSLKNIGVSDEELDIAALPGLDCWYDPGAIELVTGAAPDLMIKERAGGVVYESEAAITRGTINGQPASLHTVGLSRPSGYDLGVGSYTRLVVVNVTAVVASKFFFGRHGSGGMKFSTQTEGKLFLQSSTSVVTGNTALTVGRHILAVTYDATLQTAKLWIDGVLDRTALTFLPPTDGRVHLLGNAEAGGAAIPGGPYPDYVGHILSFSLDYSKSAYQAQWNWLHQTLAAKYGISLP